ncbi:hypothetical protein SCHPADRAFT_895963 [Schizopora paradoxa]|uniref:Uncharacterized protein n=1 Tax=Schizopora paradoxa TaxID=27342 RepID=A0A0H2R218_9AGAM|nr:hypothetical protein SCHPADRAFT_895963 [Schizopora paradoxa]
MCYEAGVKLYRRRNEPIESVTCSQAPSKGKVTGKPVAEPRRRKAACSEPRPGHQQRRQSPARKRAGKIQNSMKAPRRQTSKSITPSTPKNIVRDIWKGEPFASGAESSDHRCMSKEFPQHIWPNFLVVQLRWASFRLPVAMAARWSSCKANWIPERKDDDSEEVYGGASGVGTDSESPRRVINRWPRVTCLDRHDRQRRAKRSTSNKNLRSSPKKMPSAYQKSSLTPFESDASTAGHDNALQVLQILQALEDAANTLQLPGSQLIRAYGGRWESTFRYVARGDGI